MTTNMGSIWNSYFAKRPFSASLGLGFAAVLGALVLMFAFVIGIFVAVAGAAGWVLLRLAPRQPAKAARAPAARASSGEVLEARRTAEGWVVEATSGG